MYYVNFISVPSSHCARIQNVVDDEASMIQSSLPLMWLRNNLRGPKERTIQRPTPPQSRACPIVSSHFALSVHTRRILLPGLTIVPCSDWHPSRFDLDPARKQSLEGAQVKQKREEARFAVFQGTSNGGQRSSIRKTRVNRRSDLPYNGTIWRFDRLLLKNWRPPYEVPWKTEKPGPAGEPAPVRRVRRRQYTAAQRLAELRRCPPPSAMVLYQTRRVMVILQKTARHNDQVK